MSLHPDPAAQARQLRRRLEAAFANFDSAVISAGDRALDRAPAVSPWSVLDVAEHVTLTNRYLLVLAEKCARKSLRRREQGETSEDDTADSASLEALARPEFRWDAPPHMLPTGGIAWETIRRKLEEQRDHCLALVDLVPPEAVGLHTIRMTVVGPCARLNAHEFLACIALHAERHAAQVRRITLASSGTPL